jgi:glycosyltransferase involved in cell wall biosynthesis
VSTIEADKTIMRAPRLLMLLHDCYPQEPRVASEARAARAAGFEVTVVALREPGEEPDEVVEGVRVVRLPVRHEHGGARLSLLREYVLFTTLAAAHAVRLARGARPDVVHVHNPPDFLVVAALLPRLLGAKVVLDFHDLTPDMFMMRFENRDGGTLDRSLRLVERWTAKMSDAVLTVHEPYRQVLGANGVPVEKVSVVMNSLDERILPAPRVSGGAPPESFRVVYHGTATPHYGVDLIVDAVALARPQIPSVRLDVYGGGDAHSEVASRVRAHGLEDVVGIVPRFLPQEEVLRLVQGASAGVAANLPTRLSRYALPTKLLEYVAMGIPAVAPSLPTIREHFTDEEVWFFEPGDAESLAAALVAVASDPEAASRRTENARNRYEAYRWPRSAATYIDLIWRLAQKRRRALAAHRPTAAASS